MHTFIMKVLVCTQWFISDSKRAKVHLLYLLLDSCPDSTTVYLDRALETMAGWLKQRWLKLNPVKTEVLSLGLGAIGSEIQLPALDGLCQHKKQGA